MIIQKTYKMVNIFHGKNQGGGATRGPRGYHGVQGEKGPKGDKGDTGATGATGAKGNPSTIAGPQGPKGDKGDKGKDSTVPGPKGDKGDKGKDSTVPGPKGDKGDPAVVKVEHLGGLSLNPVNNELRLAAPMLLYTNGDPHLRHDVRKFVVIRINVYITQVKPLKPLGHISEAMHLSPLYGGSPSQVKILIGGINGCLLTISTKDVAYPFQNITTQV